MAELQMWVRQVRSGREPSELEATYNDFSSPAEKRCQTSGLDSSIGKALASKTLRTDLLYIRSNRAPEGLIGGKGASYGPARRVRPRGGAARAAEAAREASDELFFCFLKL